MIIITDSNIIFSALMSPKGTVAKIFKSKSQIQFVAPDFMLIEIKNHWDKIIAFSSLDKKEFEYLNSRIKFVDIATIPQNKIVEAYEIVKEIDLEDTYFVALHLHKKHKIWTSDKILINGLAKKGYKICITTAELKTKLYKK
jgi:predicted nucleic acid-binding protein